MTALHKQLPLDLSYRPALGREDFLIAPSNQDAVRWIDRWPDWPAPVLIIHGPVASGKSHLAAVWGAMAKAAFVDTAALNEKTAGEIAAMGNHLVINDADLWFGDRDAETTLFHLYNHMKDDGNRSLLLTCRMAAQYADFILPDLASRLRAAPAAAIHAPDDTLLAALLVKLFSDRQLQIGAEVLNYILPRMERSFAAAYNLVAEADKLALAEKKAISVPLVRRILMDRQDISGAGELFS